MTKVEQIEQQVRRLSARELASFRAWFSEFDAAAWDQQLEADATAARLDARANAALADHAARHSRPL